MMTTLRLDKFLPYRLSVASNRVSDMIARGYRARFGLRIPEWRMIAVLAETGGMTQQALTHRTRMDKVTVSRAAIALAERGLIERLPNEADQRSHLLALSGDGRALYEEIAPLAIDTERRLLAGFAPEDIDRLGAMLERLEHAAETLGRETPVE